MQVDTKNGMQEFHFNEENEVKIQNILAKYPPNRSKSAILPLLDLAQRQNNGWLSNQCLIAVGKKLNLPRIYVHEVASFYSMFFLQPVGKHVIEVCQTLSCMLCGAKKITKILKEHLNIDMFETTKDCMFTLRPIECLGSCISAPVMKIGDNYYEDLDSENVIQIVESLRKNESPKCGSQKGRISSEPIFENL